MSANNFWVDPDALERHARPYDEAADRFEKLCASLDELLARYPNAFGGDDLGQQFSSSFNKGVDGIKDRIDVVSQRMAYIGDGLRVSAQSYRQAEDSAQDVSSKLNAYFQTKPENEQANSNGNHKSVGPPEEDSVQATARGLPNGEQVGPGDERELRDDTPMPGEVDRALLTSRLFSPTTGDGIVQIDGVPVGDEFRLIAANEVADGKVRLDVDAFETIIPVGGDRSVTVDGLPVPVPDDHQWFVVKDAPAGSDSGPGNLVEFGRDGSAVGIQP